MHWQLHLLLTWVLWGEGSKLKSSCLFRKFFTEGAISTDDPANVLNCLHHPLFLYPFPLLFHATSSPILPGCLCFWLTDYSLHSFSKGPRKHIFNASPSNCTTDTWLQTSSTVSAMLGKAKQSCLLITLINGFCLFRFHCLEASGSRRRKEHSLVMDRWLLRYHFSFSDQPNQNQLTSKMTYLSAEFAILVSPCVQVFLLSVLFGGLCCCWVFSQDFINSLWQLYLVTARPIWWSPVESLHIPKRWLVKRFQQCGVKNSHKCLWPHSVRLTWIRSLFTGKRTVGLKCIFIT